MTAPPAAADSPNRRSHVQLDATVSGQGRVYQAGGDQIVNQTVLPEAALRPVSERAAPSATVNVPGHRQVFVGRGDELAALEAALGGSGPVVVAAVHGLGGIGKSTLAAHFAVTQTGACNPVWWITADSATGMQAGLAALALALQPELAAALPLEALAERATGWLAAHEGWLLILDNVTDPADVAPLLGRTLAGRVLVTSRLGQGWHHLGARVLRLDVLEEAEALELLTRIATPRQHAPAPGTQMPEALDGAIELVRELGYLPLAIEQAAAYLHQARLTPRAYLNLLTEYPAVMYDQAAEGNDAERTIARVWRLTVDRLTHTPLAGDLLRILAWYGAEPIPRSVLDGLADPPQLQQALGALAAYSMITLDDAVITVHRLVQAVARTPDPDDPHRQATDIDTARTRAIRLLDQARPHEYEIPASWPQWRTLLPHIDAVFERMSPETDAIDADDLLRNTGLFLESQGAIGRALIYLERCMTLVQRVYDLDHPAVLVTRASLAYAYDAAGDLGRAIPLMEHNLAEEERILGPEHPNTLASRSNLAGAYEAAGDLARAIPLYEATLADCERVLGADHPRTLTSRSNLACAYEAAGDLARAIPLYEATLSDFERVLGADHPHTLTCRNNLAYAYETAGDLGRAIPLFEATLAERERVLGPDHPSTLTSRNNLACAYRAAGDLSRAIPLYEATVSDCERVLGLHHPTTQVVQENLKAAIRRTQSGQRGRVDG
ncbi:tetratricopeptide repeat protein [Nonomuraea angiospora]|uniref:Tetratricopeptide (TPR) repeat protein n=1 Tax=Nonomuraea angiospora TaxID=46172 RepID=A0ABR9LVZ4_9ACTN|nr:tetratricopeptide repeat protein [Nonomuraea angiospora]MBE1584428.1 tetratricopeptide (TPR) repeat protein [Nonomuraea angiospora]